MHVPDKGFVYKELQINKKRKTNNSTGKQAGDMDRHFTEDETHMAHMHMSRCSASSAIREMEPKAQ